MTSEPPRLSRADRRLLLGSAAVLSVTEAAELLPWSDSVARRWLRDEKLIAKGPTGKDLVLWGKVTARLFGQVEEVATTVDEPPIPAKGRRPRQAAPENREGASWLARPGKRQKA